MSRYKLKFLYLYFHKTYKDQSRTSGYFLLTKNYLPTKNLPHTKGEGLLSTKSYDPLSHGHVPHNNIKLDKVVTKGDKLLNHMALFSRGQVRSPDKLKTFTSSLTKRMPTKLSRFDV